MILTKKQIQEELILDLSLQHKEKWNSYKIFFEEDLVLNSQKQIHKAILTYCDFIEDANLIYNLIKELEKNLKGGNKKNGR